MGVLIQKEKFGHTHIHTHGDGHVNTNTEISVMQETPSITGGTRSSEEKAMMNTFSFRAFQRAWPY